MSFFIQLATLLKTSKQIKFAIAEHETKEDHLRLIITPIVRRSADAIKGAHHSTLKNNTEIKQIEGSLASPFTIVGTPEEIEEQLPAALEQIANARNETNNNLVSLVKNLTKAASIKTAAKPVSKVATTPATKVTTTPKVVIKEPAKATPPVVESAQVSMF
jgi:PRTRC genetic system protein E